MRALLTSNTIGRTRVVPLVLRSRNDPVSLFCRASDRENRSHFSQMRSMGALLLAGIVLAGASVALQAQSSLPAGSPGRFTMHPTEGGVLRLDTQTGVLSMCRQSGGSWACAMMPDDRAAVTDQIERLKSENGELRGAIKRLEEMAGVPDAPADKSGDSTTKRQSGVQLPTEEELDKAMSYVQRMLKKFKDKIKELEGPEGKKGTQL